MKQFIIIIFLFVSGLNAQIILRPNRADILTGGAGSPTPVAIDSNLFANTGASVMYNGSSYNGSGQSFTSDGSYSIDSVVVQIDKDGSPTDSVYCRIYTHSGTYGTSSVPDVELGYTAVLATDLLSAEASYYTFIFEGDYAPVEISSGYYVFAIEYSGGDVSNVVNVRQDSDHHTGNRCRLTLPSSWSARSTEDIYFIVWGH